MALLRPRPPLFWLALASLLLIVVPSAAQTDWIDITDGIAGQTLPYPTDSLGVPGYFNLRNNTFPVLLSADGSYAICAAARVGPGRIVAFNKESYTTAACSANATLCNGPTGRLAINVLRWAAGKPVPTARRRLLAPVTVRLSAPSGTFSTTFFNNLVTAGAAIGVNFVKPTGQTSFLLSSPSLLIGTGGAIADVYLTTAHVVYTSTELAALTSFIQGGGGLVTGGQGWSSSDITTFPGNLLLAPLNVVDWTTNSGDWYPQSIAVPATAPDPVLFNTDLAAKALLNHLSGASPLAPAALDTVANLLKKALAPTNLAYNAASDALWANPSTSQLAVALSGRSAGWACGAVVPDALNILQVAYLSKLQNTGPASSVPVFPCAATFPGLPSAAPVTAQVTVNLTYAGTYTGPMPPRGGSNWVSTGLWAPAGQVVTVSISPTVAASLTASGVGSLTVQIGSHDDDISKKSTWCRLPFGVLASRQFAPGQAQLQTASGLGGLIYLKVAFGTTLGPVDVTVANAIRAPFFFSGMSEADWRAVGRNNPAPFAEIGSNKFVMTLPSSSIRALDNPQAIVDMWDKALDAIADLTVFTRDRPRAERFVLDCDISAGYMHSGYPLMGPLSAAPDFLSTDYTDPAEMRKWGPFHELGHNHQFSAWTLPNTGETTNNIYSVYLMEKIMRVPRTARSILGADREANTATYLNGGSFTTDWSVWTALYTYLQLQENMAPGNYTAGWEFYKRVLTRYQQIQGTAAVGTDDLKIQTWIKETSNISGFNLINFYKAWKFPVTAETEAAVAAIPGLQAFPFNPAAPCGSVCNDCCVNDVTLPDIPVATITPTNGLSWGSWSGFSQCQGSSWVTGMKTRTQPDQGPTGDNTGLQAISMACSTATGVSTGDIRPHPGLLGNWSGPTACPAGHRVNAFMLRTKPAGGDDIAAAAIRLKCTDESTILDTPGSLVLGTWPSAWTSCPAGSALCGFKVLFEPDQGSGDDTALNSVTGICCTAPTAPAPTPPAPVVPHVFTATLNMTNGVNLGNWQNQSNCPNGAWVTGMSTRVEAANSDNTGLNAVTLICSTRLGTQAALITPYSGLWGSWSDQTSLPGLAWVTALRLRVLPYPQPNNGDDLAVDAIQLRGSDGTVLDTLAALGQGTFGSWVSCPAGSALCGINVRFQPRQGSGDDTAVDDVQGRCCQLY